MGEHHDNRDSHNNEQSDHAEDISSEILENQTEDKCDTRRSDVNTGERQI